MGRAFECRRRAKESRWATMSKVFPKLAKSITLAAKGKGLKEIAKALNRSEESTKERAKIDGIGIAKLR